MAVVLALVMLGAVGCVEAPAEPILQGTAKLSSAERSSTMQEETRRRADEDGAERRARAASVRLRITGPDIYGASVGSGFAVEAHTVITNAHVVARGTQVDVVAWDGEETQATSGRMAVRTDLAAVATAGRVPATPLELAGQQPQPGDRVTIVGFPGGGQITVETAASVVDPAYEGPLPAREPVMAIAADSVEPGSSGGPVLNRAGEVVGVVFAVERATGRVLAIPASTLRSWLRSSGIR